ncbi:MAG: Gfo/Idh/MocA family oxidoreductase [Acidobacteriota bacterium]
MNRELRAGVVGVGHLGRHHARLYSSMPGVRLVGVVDTNPEQAAAIAAQFGASVFESAAGLASQVDLASVATPTESHLEAALPLLDAGVPVLVEKPIAPDEQVARKLIERAADRGAALMIGHTERFHPAVSALLERLQRPRFIEIHRLAPFVPRSLDVDVVLDLMIHDLDLSRVLLGGEEVVMLDASGTPALTEKIDLASVRLRFAQGAAANLTASRISAVRMRRIRVFERGAYFACDTGAGTLEVNRIVTTTSGGREVVREQVVVPKDEPLGCELAAFVTAVRERSPVPCTGEDGLAALKLARRIVAQIERDPG